MAKALLQNKNAWLLLNKFVFFPKLKSRASSGLEWKRFAYPVLLISLGSDAIFSYGKNKNDLSEICLKTVSICILKDSTRLYYHGVKKSKKWEEILLMNVILIVSQKIVE